jgi:hypothetical protein
MVPHTASTKASKPSRVGSLPFRVWPSQNTIASADESSMAPSPQQISPACASALLTSAYPAICRSRVHFWGPPHILGAESHQWGEPPPVRQDQSSQQLLHWHPGCSSSSPMGSSGSSSLMGAQAAAAPWVLISYDDSYAAAPWAIKQQPQPHGRIGAQAATAASLAPQPQQPHGRSSNSRNPPGGRSSVMGTQAAHGRSSKNNSLIGSRSGLGLMGAPVAAKPMGSSGSNSFMGAPVASAPMGAQVASAPMGAQVGAMTTPWPWAPATVGPHGRSCSSRAQATTITLWAHQQPPWLQRRRPLPAATTSWALPAATTSWALELQPPYGCSTSSRSIVVSSNDIVAP